MPDLQSCYFCGTPENVQEFAVVPPRFTPDGADPQSAVLCGRCKTKLLQVVQPLTEQLGKNPGSPESATSTTPSPESTQPTEPTESRSTMSGGDDGGANIPSQSGEPGEPTTGETSTPPNYRRAMRMLSNREFPLERTEVESMLAGAYDLERHEVTAVLEHATETGQLREDDGQFYRD